MEVRIQHFELLNRTPALPLAVHGWMELIQNGHCSNYIQIRDYHQALVAFVDGRPAGVLTFEAADRTNDVAICLGYVNPEFRGLGLYRQLWDALVDHAQTLGVATITSAAYLTNTVMRQVAAAQGRVEKTVTIDFEVPY